MSSQWEVLFQPLRGGPMAASFHLHHDHATGGGAIDVDLTGMATVMNPDAGPDAAMPDGGPGPDGGNGFDASSYYACDCSSGSPTGAAPYAILVLLGLGYRRRRR